MDYYLTLPDAYDGAAEHHAREEWEEWDAQRDDVRVQRAIQDYEARRRRDD